RRFHPFARLHSFIGLCCRSAAAADVRRVSGRAKRRSAWRVRHHDQGGPARNASDPKTRGRQGDGNQGQEEQEQHLRHPPGRPRRFIPRNAYQSAAMDGEGIRSRKRTEEKQGAAASCARNGRSGCRRIRQEITASFSASFDNGIFMAVFTPVSLEELDAWITQFPLGKALS